MSDVIEARAWAVGDSVDTDNMYPGFAMKLGKPAIVLIEQRGCAMHEEFALAGRQTRHD